MQVFKIEGTPSLENKYRGSGYAIGAVVGGLLVDYKYLRDVLMDFEGDFTEDGNGQHLALAALNDPRLAPVVREMQALGEMLAGMCGSYEFVVL